MVAILISWIVIFITLFSIGDIFLRLYNRFCKCEESYNVLDTTLLGMCAILVPLSITSLWLPSNQYILFGFISISVIYWCMNWNRLRTYYMQTHTSLNSLSILQKVLIILSISTVIVGSMWSPSFHDSAFYHYPNIWWNESYQAIPGLANLEDRFGFNSNYLLLSAIFSFRFLFGEPIYTLQSLLLILMLGWVLVKLFKSNFNICNILLLIFFLVFFFTFDLALTDANTDGIPNLCIFYILARTVFKPSYFSKDVLLIFILSISLITFKLSSVIFCIICIPILVTLIKGKKYSQISFIVISSLLIIGLWFTRNVIISGYLVYPLYQIDLFDVDWKVPAGSAFLQKTQIYEWARYRFNTATDLHYIFNRPELSKIDIFSDFVIFIYFILSLISSIIVAISIFCKSKINKNIYFIYSVSIVTIIFWFISAPDFRFIQGCILGNLFIVSYIILSILKKTHMTFPKSGIVIVSLAIILFFAQSVKKSILKSGFASNKTGKEKYDLWLSALYKPFPNFLLITSKETYGIGENKSHIDIVLRYLNSGKKNTDFDSLPIYRQRGVPFTAFDGDKVQSLKTIERRGEQIQMGFRTSNEYIEIINNNIEKYKSEYELIYQEKITKFKY